MKKKLQKMKIPSTKAQIVDQQYSALLPPAILHLDLPHLTPICLPLAGSPQDTVPPLGS